MTNRLRLLALCTFFLNVVPGIAAPALPETDRSRPNIILIMVDDMGYSDIGCYGGEVNTPNIDMLAKKGLRFTQFYNTAKCHTTRAELLTGNYAYQIGDKDLAYGATFGEVLRTVGYRTLISGKWHQSPLPTTRGFDRYYGLADGCCNFFNPGLEARKGEGAPGRKGKTRVRRWAFEDKVIMGYTNPDPKFYTTDAFTTYAIEQGKQRKPHKEIYWRFNKANAVRQGDLKAIRAGKSWELYDLKADPTETNNLAGEHPEKARELAEMWERWNTGSVGNR